MFSTIDKANLPTLVPPYFCTHHLASGSIVFWCKFGGVASGGVSMEGDEREEAGDVGVDGPDMVPHDEMRRTVNSGQRPCCAEVAVW